MRAVRYRRDLGALLVERGLPLAAAELGVAEGRFSLEMLAWGLSSLYLVDAWVCQPGVPGDASSPQAWHDANLAGCAERVGPYLDRVVFLRGRTDSMAVEVPDGSLGLVYVDACHAREWVLRDLQAWAPKVAPRGILAGHDFLGEPGVRAAVEEFALSRGLDVHPIPEDREEDAGFWLELGR